MKVLFVLTVLVVATVVNAGYKIPKPRSKATCLACVPRTHCSLAVKCHKARKTCYTARHRCYPYVYRVLFMCLKRAKKAFKARLAKCNKMRKGRRVCYRRARIALRKRAKKCRHHLALAKKHYAKTYLRSKVACPMGCKKVKVPKLKAKCLEHCKTLHMRTKRRKFCVPILKCYYGIITCARKRWCRSKMRCRNIRCPRRY